MDTPPTNLFTDFTHPLGIPDDMIDEAFEQLNQMRHLNDIPVLKFEPVLRTLSLRPLQKLQEGQWNRLNEERRLQAAGFVGGPVYQLACTGKDVGSCLDQMTWSIDAREALLNPQIRAVGIEAFVSTAGMSMVISMASD